MIQFQGDKGSFMVNWPFVWAASNGAVEEGSLEKAVVDDIGWAQWPRVNADEPSAPPLGGINIGVGADSQNQELAWEAVECIVTPEHQSQYFATNGNPPSSAKAFDDAAVREAYPQRPSSGNLWTTRHLARRLRTTTRFPPLSSRSGRPRRA